MHNQRYDEILAETLETMEMMKDHDIAEWIADLIWKLETEDQENGKT